MSKVLVGLSGGVDSTAAAIILKNKGYEVEGVFLDLVPNADTSALMDAKLVADKLGIKLHILDEKDYFKDEIIDYFTSEYELGRTPNPCVICNKKIKFGKMIEFADTIEADYVATGHYSKIDYIDGLYKVLKSNNLYKDQTYMFYMLSQEQLSRILFPLGDYSDKEEIRKIVADNGVEIYKKSDSQDICFIPDGDYVKFLKNNKVKSKIGKFVDAKGEILGEHKGIYAYTVGQRRGLGISSSERLFVKKIDPKTTNITLVHSKDMIFNGCILKELYLSYDNFENVKSELFCKVRYGSKEYKCCLKKEDGKWKVDFLDKVNSVSPGQSLVLYDGVYLYGGGIVSEVY